MRRLFVILTVIVLAPAPPVLAGGGAAAGFPRPVSGDMLAFDGYRVRLAGILAPAPGTLCRVDNVTYGCGAASKAALARAIGSWPVVCTGQRHEQVYPLPARCRRGRTDLNALMTRLGWARVDFRTCKRRCTALRAAEAAARSEKRGIWKGALPKELADAGTRRPTREDGFFRRIVEGAFDRSSDSP